MDYCGDCDIAYDAKNCPLCELKSENKKLIKENIKLQNKVWEYEKKLDKYLKK